MDIINKRRSVRKFDKTKEITRDEIALMLRAAMQAPSAVNKQPWEFIVVDDKKILEEMSHGWGGAKPLVNATAAIVVLGNKDRTDYVDFMSQDLSAATQNILLKATDLKIGSVWIGCYPGETRIKFIKNMFDLTDNVVPFSVIALGHLLDEEHLFYRDNFDENRIKYNKE